MADRGEIGARLFNDLCDKAYYGKTGEVLVAVDQDRRLLVKADVGGKTVLLSACGGRHDNPQLVLGLLERGCDVNTRNRDGWSLLMWASANGHILVCTILVERKADVLVRSNSGWDALMAASRSCHIAVCTVLLDRGVDPDSRSDTDSALLLAAYYDHIQVCLLLISRRANLMLVVDGRTALNNYGDRKRPVLTPDELEERRAIVLTAFEQGPHPDMCLARRWPFVCVLVGCDFQPLLARQLVLLALNPPLPPDAQIPPIEIATPEQYRAYLHGCIFAHPGFWKLIASYL